MESLHMTETECQPNILNWPGLVNFSKLLQVVLLRVGHRLGLSRRSHDWPLPKAAPNSPISPPRSGGENP